MTKKKNKALILASVASMIDQFNLPNISLLQTMGYQVDVACNFKEGNTCSDEEIKLLRRRLHQMGVQCYQIDFARNVTCLKQNMKAFWQVERLLLNNEYAFLHCHSPIGGVIGRIAGKLTGTKVIYTAHGFHFYNGAPVKNWLIYYPIEKCLAHWTGILITINQEDYTRAKAQLKARKVVYVPGVGVDLTKYGSDTAERADLRKALEIPDNMLWVLSVGELIDRKNHEILIRAVACTQDIYLTIAGQGPLLDGLMRLSEKLGVSDRVRFLGFRTDVAKLCENADVFAIPSFQEGLSKALMEGMSCAKPVICSRIRGNTDLIEEGRGGFLFDPKSTEDAANALRQIRNADLKSMGAYNREKIRQYDLNVVMVQMTKIYDEISIGAEE
ncbi:MAG: glycosyltransferase family 4 protein [Lachnospiraceae bacterium]|nr:glycosyltransferase family 4 protein [Lachnospiraceae bacterium]